MKNADDDEPVLVQIDKLSKYVDDPEPMELGEIRNIQNGPEEPFQFLISAATFGQWMDKMSEEFGETEGNGQ